MSCAKAKREEEDRRGNRKGAGARWKSGREREPERERDDQGWMKGGKCKGEVTGSSTSRLGVSRCKTEAWGRVSLQRLV